MAGIVSPFGDGGTGFHLCHPNAEGEESWQHTVLDLNTDELKPEFKDKKKTEISCWVVICRIATAIISKIRVMLSLYFPSLKEKKVEKYDKVKKYSLSIIQQNDESPLTKPQFARVHLLYSRLMGLNETMADINARANQIFDQQKLGEGRVSIYVCRRETNQVISTALLQVTKQVPESKDENIVYEMKELPKKEESYDRSETGFEGRLKQPGGKIFVREKDLKQPEGASNAILKVWGQVVSDENHKKLKGLVHSIEMQNYLATRMVSMKIQDEKLVIGMACVEGVTRKAEVTDDSRATKVKDGLKLYNKNIELEVKAEASEIDSTRTQYTVTIDKL